MTDCFYNSTPYIIDNRTKSLLVVWEELKVACKALNWEVKLENERIILSSPSETFNKFITTDLDVAVGFIEGFKMGFASAVKTLGYPQKDA